MQNMQTFLHLYEMLRRESGGDKERFQPIGRKAGRVAGNEEGEKCHNLAHQCNQIGFHYFIKVWEVRYQK